MKRTILWLSIISIMVLFVLSCGGSDSSVSNDAGAQTTETSFNFTLASLKKQETANSALGRQASFTADQVMTGQLTTTNTVTSAVQTFDWSIYFDEDTFDVQSNKTIILPPGTYNFALLLIKGDQQYAGSVTGQAINDGTFDVPMTIRPIIGNTITDVTLLAALAEFKFQYDPAELAAASLSNPQMGIIIGGGTETIYGINSSTGISDIWINLDEGSNTIQLKLYDGSLQVGRSITAQESVIVTAGLNIIMDLVALHGETTFALTEAGGDATFSFNIPSEVVDEAGGLGNLQVLFSLVGSNNPLDENLLTLAPDGAGDYEAFITLSNKKFDEVTLSLAFTDSSISELLGSCAMVATLDTTQRTLNCDVTLRRRAIIGGSLLATLGINVFNEAGEPVAGAVVSENGNILGITGSGAFGTAGYLKIYLNEGTYTLKAETIEKYGESGFSLSPLIVTNQTIILDHINNTASTSIVGGWGIGHQVGDVDHKVSLTFYLDNSYIFWHKGDDLDPCASNGAEYGTYTYNETTKMLVPTVQFDETGCAGFSEDNGNEIYFNVSGNGIYTAGGDLITERVIDLSHPLVGSWGSGHEAGDVDHKLTLTFYSNNSYIFWHKGDDLAPCASSGVEYGTYAYNDITKIFIPTVQFDENGCAGLSDDNGNEIYFNVSGNGIYTAGGDLILERVTE